MVSRAVHINSKLPEFQEQQSCGGIFENSGGMGGLRRDSQLLGVPLQ